MDLREFSIVSQPAERLGEGLGEIHAEDAWGSGCSHVNIKSMGQDARGTAETETLDGSKETRLLQNYVALAGEYLVLGELALRGLDASLTLGHTKEIDILLLRREPNGFFRVEVKASSGDVRQSTIFGSSYEWLMNERHGSLVEKRLIYCFVRTTLDVAHRRFFLVPSEDVAAYIRWEFEYWKAHSERRTGKVSALRTFRIPVKGVTDNPLPPSWRDGRWARWENNWAIFGQMPIGEAQKS